MPTSKGYVITASISSIKNIDCDEIWQITRSGKYLDGTVLVKNLSPSPELFNIYINEWKNKAPDYWWPLYEAKFNEELKTEEKLVALRKLWNLVKMGKVITIACFCKDSTYCHRTLVGNFLKKKNITVLEYQKEIETIEHNEYKEYKQLTLF